MADAIYRTELAKERTNERARKREERRTKANRGGLVVAGGEVAAAIKISTLKTAAAATRGARNRDATVPTWRDYARLASAPPHLSAERWHARLYADDASLLEKNVLDRDYMRLLARTLGIEIRGGVGAYDPVRTARTVLAQILPTGACSKWRQSYEDNGYVGRYEEAAPLIVKVHASGKHQQQQRSNGGVGGGGGRDTIETFFAEYGLRAFANVDLAPFLFSRDTKNGNGGKGANLFASRFSSSSSSSSSVSSCHKRVFLAHAYLWAICQYCEGQYARS